VKIQLIRLEEHDDIISARDKLGWGQTGRVVLVWPEAGKQHNLDKLHSMATRRFASTPLTHRLDLLLLQRRAFELGIQLAFVSRNSEVRAHALSLGIPVFNSPREAQNLRWHRTRRHRFPWQLHNIEARRLTFRQQIAAHPPHHSLVASNRLPFLVRAIVFTLGILAVIALSAALLPGAQITLVPAIQTQTITLPVSASSKIAAVNLSGEVPTYPITTIVEGQTSLKATGITTVPDQFANGYVRFTNLTTETITVPLGTIVTAPFTDTIRFATTQVGLIASGPGSSVYITVQAMIPGSYANLPAGSIRVIEGPLNYHLAVTNIAATRGGTDRIAPSPSPEDRIRLYNQLVAILRQNALVDLEAKIPSGDLLLTPTLKLDSVLLKIYDPDSTLPATSLRLTLRMQYRVESVSTVDLYRLGATLLDASLPDGYTPLPDTLKIDIDSQPQLDRDQVAHLEITARRDLQGSLSREKAVSLVLGMPPQQAVQQLAQSMPLANAPRITVDPGWWPRMPFIPLRISISTQGVEK
jgi:hypothetical protein